ncbi:MAG: ATPase, T2SS/T4P/T4SS family [Candidatus Ratteibacteria bacterium]|jgi:type IV pilus assembly protein PilB
MPTKREITTIIQNMGLWDKRTLDRALEDLESSGRPLKEIFQSMGLLPIGEISPTLFFQLGIVQQELPAREIPKNVLTTISSSFVKKHRIIPWEIREDGKLIVASDDPLNILATDYFKKAVDWESEIEVFITFPNEIDQLLEKYYEQQDIEDLSSLLQEAGSSSVEAVEEEEEIISDEDEEALALQAPVVKIVNLIFVEALRRRASDIHLEPLEKRFRVRFRIDGVLYEVVSPPKRIERATIARIKLMAKMNLAEKRVPQDGRINLDLSGRPIDFRVSALPGVYGESVVMRILDKTTSLKDLEQLGFVGNDLVVWETLMKYSGGIVLVTGPTGSGKTTTLYASLKKLNTIDKKLMTVEEPVEYQIAGINQTPVLSEIGRTFSAILRAFLRQSPDIILVGEIRDVETADIALRAALTGHLVFSTLHTNDAPSAITRLIDLGIPPFLVASAVQGVMAQRLVRVLCKYCKEPYQPTPEEERILDRKEGEPYELFQPKGCAECNFTGFSGRLGVFEIFQMTDKMRELTLQRVSASELRKAAIQHGMKSMRDDGIAKTKQGITTLQEIFDVAGEE